MPFQSLGSLLRLLAILPISDKYNGRFLDVVTCPQGFGLRPPNFSYKPQNSCQMVTMLGHCWLVVTAVHVFSDAIAALSSLALCVEHIYSTKMNTGVQTSGRKSGQILSYQRGISSPVNNIHNKQRGTELIRHKMDSFLLFSVETED